MKSDAIMKDIWRKRNPMPLMGWFLSISMFLCLFSGPAQAQTPPASTYSETRKSTGITPALEAQGDVIRTCPGPVNVMGMHYVPSQDVLYVVAEDNAGRIYKYDENCNITDDLPGPSGDGNLNGVTFDGQYLWVSDYGGSDEVSDMLYKLDANTGAVIDSWDLRPQGIDGILGIAWDGQSLWVSSVWNATIFELDISGNVVGSFQVSWVNTGLDWDGQYLVSADDAGGKIYLVTTNGTVVDSMPAPFAGGAFGVTCGGSPGQLWHSNYETENLYLLECSWCAGDGDERRVLLIKDADPWGYPQNEVVLNDLGFAYDLINSGAIAGTDLSPYCLIIIASDQPQPFYDAFYANLDKFEVFVDRGGILQINACDQGGNMGWWNRLPGGVTHESDFDYQNFVVELAHPIVEGVPSPFNGSSASHGHFLNVPPGAILITEDEAGLPTTVEYSLGSGTVVASMVTLEFGHERNDDYALMLPNTIRYARSLCKQNGCVEDDSGALDIQGFSGGPGARVIVPVRIQNAPNPVASLGFELAYDSNLLQYKDYTPGDCVANFDYFDVNEQQPGLLVVGGFEGGDDVIPQGSDCTVVRLEFTISDCDPGKVYPLGTLQNLVDDMAGWNASPGCLTPWTCDVNGDGDITPQDALCAFQKYLGVCPTSCGPCDQIFCDVNGDGDCTPADALEIFREYLGIRPNACSP